MLTTLTIPELVMATFAMAAVLLGPLVLVVRSRRHTDPSPEDFKKLVASTPLPEGFEAKVIENGHLELFLPSSPLKDDELEVEYLGYRANDGATSTPTFDDLFRFQEAKGEILRNLRLSPPRLVPFSDFVFAWSREVKVARIETDRAVVAFRLEGSQASASEMLPQAAVGLAAFYRAASKPGPKSDEPDTLFPKWAILLRSYVDGRYWLLALAMLATSVAGLIITNLYHSTHLDRISTTWPSAEGRMVVSKVRTRTTTHGHGMDRHTDTTHMALLEYEYVVDGKTYKGERYSFFREYVHGDDAFGASGGYPEGSVVRVYYDPEDPSEAIIHQRQAEPNSGNLLWSLGYLPSLLFMLAYFKLDRPVRAAKRRLRHR